MRWFYFLLYILPGIQLLSGQGCGDYDLIRNPENWRGDTAEFVFYPDRIELDASSAGTASLVMDHMPGMKAFFIRFSLDFPPSLTNQFRLSLFLGTGSGVKRQIVLIVGETGDQDGVLVEVRENDLLIGEQKYWLGKYGSGAQRSEWVLSPEDGFLLLSDPVNDQTEKINLELVDGDTEIYFEKTEVQCHFTQSRRNRFHFHQMQMWTDDFRGRRSFTAGDVFMTEIFTGSSSYAPFVEIFNSTSADICISGFALRIEEDYVDLPPLSLASFSYLALHAEQENHHLFLEIPSLAWFLDNRREGLFFLDLLHHGKLIHQVKIFFPVEKTDYSHEMIDILHPCRVDNWVLSEERGGSPGMENSVFGTLTAPQLHLEWYSFREAEIKFPYTEVDSVQLFSLVEVPEGINLRSNTEDGSGIILTAREGIEKYFDILIRGTVIYCGDMTDEWDTTLQVHFPVLPEEHEILITEVMYDPPAGCPEYLEIANVAGKAVWTGDLFLSREGGNPVSVSVPGREEEGVVWVVTADRSGFIDCFPEGDSGLIIEERLFVLPNRGARIYLRDGAGDRMLDEVFYEPIWHHAGFGDQKGIALERNYLDPSAEEWRSGYPQYGYRSPGFLPPWNKEEGGTDEAVVFSSQGIRPGVDFGDDRLEILWRGIDEGRQGFLSVDIYDMGGNKVNQLANSLPVQGGESIFWRGEDSGGNLLEEGLYLFWIYYFDMKGTKKIYKKICVLSRP